MKNLILLKILMVTRSNGGPGMRNTEKNGTGLAQNLEKNLKAHLNLSPEHII
jgi:hypothetical protein